MHDHTASAEHLGFEGYFVYANCVEKSMTGARTTACKLYILIDAQTQMSCINSFLFRNMRRP